jgi:hypothetical protein
MKLPRLNRQSVSRPNENQLNGVPLDCLTLISLLRLKILFVTGYSRAESRPKTAFSAQKESRYQSGLCDQVLIRRYREGLTVSFKDISRLRARLLNSQYAELQLSE